MQASVRRTGQSAHRRALVWMRRDLRMADNMALHHAAAWASDGVIAAFVASPAEWKSHHDAGVKVDFWLRNLRELSDQLAKLNIPLRCVVASSTDSVPRLLHKLASSLNCSAVYFNNEYEFDEHERDQAVESRLTQAGIAVHRFDDRVLLAPGSVLTGAGAWYSVFTPFKKRALALLKESMPDVLPHLKKQKPIDIESDAIPDHIRGFTSHVRDANQLWPAGEKAARKRLDAFVERQLVGYNTKRDMPAIDGTSKLSPYLAAGVLSPRQVLRAALDANAGRLDTGSAGAMQWISEIIWREFYQHVLVGFPHVSQGRAFKRATDTIRWASDDAAFDSWAHGRTGVPIVDAAMRQLLATGWMHNRLRMIVAMYLTKDLFIDWRLGEEWFMRHLIDGDLGSNNGGWQWAAGTGADAAPYFRIFNPVSQSKKFDPTGAFIREYVPELRDVDAKAIHDPSRWSASMRASIDYPQPMVDHAKARARVLKAFRALKP